VYHTPATKGDHAFVGDHLQHTRKRLLLIEDSPETLLVFRTLLQEDFDFMACSSCPEALMQIERLAPDLLLMDIAMAEMNGMDCLKRLRDIPKFENIPAIAVTALAYPEDKRGCLEAGFQAVVVKPVLDFDEFRRLIDATLQSSSK
jgi:CheY-like chemotaxis protein